MSAKITDFGCSRMIDMSPGQVARLTKHPGTLVYMPPEALNDSHEYGPSLDVFSFGHLALYTITQVIQLAVHDLNDTVISNEDRHILVHLINSYLSQEQKNAISVLRLINF